METRLLVGGSEDSSLGTLVWGQRGGKVELETLSDEVVELDLVTEDVGGGPGLGEGQTMDFVSPFTLNITSDDVRLGVASSGNLEGDVGRSLGLNFERSTVEVVILSEQVIGGLAEILINAFVRSRND